MKIERGVVYNPTIHHGYLLEENCHPGSRQGHERRPLPPAPCKLSRGLCSIFFILNNILYILINPPCTRVLVSQHKQQSTIIWLGITRLGSARLGSVERCSSKRATSSAVLPCAPSPSLLSSSLIFGTFFFFQPKASSSVNAQTQEKRTTKSSREGTKMSVTDLP